MRPFVLLLLCALVAPSVLSSQQPAPHPALVDDVPEGTNWIANASTHLYYPVGCPITASIPAADKLYYKNEASLQTAGFTKSAECDSSHPANPAPTATPAPPVPSATAAATPTPAHAGEKSAKQKNRRSGFWFNGGFGYGSLGCKDCGTREGSLSGGIALGGSVSQKVLLGAATTGWAKSFDGGAELDVGTLVAVIRFYPSATGAFFLLGGLGVGSIHTKSPDFGTQTETGFGALLGLGYDIRVGSNVSLTPFWNGFAVNTDTDDANVGQIGLGLTIH